MKTQTQENLLLIGVGFMIALACCIFLQPCFVSSENKLTSSPDFHSCTIPANSQWVQENCYVEEHDDFNKWNCKDGI